MLVVDASALIEVLTVDPADIPGLAQRLHDVAWMSAPDLVDCEVLNVLRKMVGRGDIDADLADDSRLALRDLRVTRHPLTDELTERIWDLRHSSSAYDASYLALAEHLGIPFVTADRRLADGLRPFASVPIEGYANTRSTPQTSR